MKITQTDVAAVARALCLAHGHDCDDIHSGTMQPRWMLYIPTARVALQVAAPVVLEKAAVVAEDEYLGGLVEADNIAAAIRALKDET